MVNLLRYNNDYFKQVYNIHAQCFDDEAMSELSFREELENNTRVYFMALCENEVVGYAGAWCCDDLEYSIISVAVKKEHRGKGIAKQLIKRLISDAKNKNIMALSLEVNEKNAAAINLYRDLGFIITNTRKNYYKGKIAAYIMWLYL